MLEAVFETRFAETGRLDGRRRWFGAGIGVF